jgi:hypothetical protein
MSYECGECEMNARAGHADNCSHRKELTCAICDKPLVAEQWIDDEHYGDVHTRCLDEQ